MSVKNGDMIQVHYTGTLEDGSVFDSSEKHGKPLEFKVGEGKVIKGFDDGVLDMKEGEEKDIHIKCDNAYGQPNPQLKQVIPMDKFPLKDAKVDMMLMIKTPDGHQMPAKIVAMSETEVTLDMNHPLAGKDLNFKLNLVKIN